jgi:hypothetical protein
MRRRRRAVARLRGGRGRHAADDARGEVGCPARRRTDVLRGPGRPRPGLSGAIPRRAGPTRKDRRSGAFALDQHRPDRRHLRWPPDPDDIAAEAPDHVPGARGAGRAGANDPGQPARRQHRRRRRQSVGRRGAGVLAVHRPPVLPPAGRLHSLPRPRDRAGAHRLGAAQRSSYLGGMGGRGGEPSRRHRDASDRGGARPGKRRARPAEPAGHQLAQAGAGAVVAHLLTNP